MNKKYLFLWFAGLILIWQGLAPTTVPTPLGIMLAVPELLANGLAVDLVSSLWLSIQAILISTGIALALSYLTYFKVFVPPVFLITKLRFIGLTGVSFLFGMYLIGHELKLGLLVFGMTVFLVTTMSSVIVDVPQSRFEYAKTLGMSQSRIFIEVVVLGTIAEAIESVRQNAAISWVMLTTVEGLVRSEGGLGALMLNENKHFKLDAVFAIQLVILLIGLSQDFAFRQARKRLCHYAN